MIYPVRRTFRGVLVRRRELLIAIGSAAAVAPFAARAQQQPTPVVGFLSSRSPDDSVRELMALRDGRRSLNP